MSDPEDPGGASRPRVEVADEQSRPLDAEALARFAESALDAAGIPDTHSLSLALVDRERIAELKEQYFGARRATDVLSFPMDPIDASGPATLGDVIICVEVAERQARGLGVPAEAELHHLLVHGILHLAGHDHERPEDERVMAAEEQRILRAVRAVAS
jgi:probable rRNA maturation factor